MNIQLHQLIKVILILQVVGLASALLKLVGLACLLADSLKKAMEMNIQLQQLFLFPLSSR